MRERLRIAGLYRADRRVGLLMIDLHRAFVCFHKPASRHIYYFISAVQLLFVCEECPTREGGWLMPPVPPDENAHPIWCFAEAILPGMHCTREFKEPAYLHASLWSVSVLMRCGIVLFCVLRPAFLRPVTFLLKSMHIKMCIPWQYVE